MSRTPNSFSSWRKLSGPHQTHALRFANTTRCCRTRYTHHEDHLLKSPPNPLDDQLPFVSPAFSISFSLTAFFST